MRRLFTLDPNMNGKGPVLFSWAKDGNYMAVAGVNRRVHIIDRQGKVLHQIPLPGPGQCLALDWDCTGDTLAVLQAGATQIPLWSFNTKKLDMMDTNMKELTFLKWSRVGPQLAVGTAKGSLLLYNHKTKKKIPIVGKHQRRILCGAWNSQNKLALGAEDKQLTISNAEGDTLDQAHMKSEPASIQFSDMKADERQKHRENTVSVNMGGKTLLLYNTTDQDNPIELAFQPRYGNIVSYQWFGDGYILIGFSSGYVVVISTHLREIGQEVNSIRFHRDNLSAITYCASLQKGASIGDNCVKTFDMSELSKMSEQRSEKVELDNEFGTLLDLQWTEDGQILTVSSKHGYVYAFLTRIPVLNDTWGTRVLYLTSLRELCVKDFVLDEDIARIPIEIEPSFVSLGPNTAAVGMNNSLWYYRFSDAQGTKLLRQRPYLSTVQSVRLSKDYAAVLMDGRVTLHPIEEEDKAGARERVFPEQNTADISAAAITEQFLIFSTSRGTLHYFSLEDWAYISEHRFDTGIVSLYPNTNGTRLVFVDSTHAAYMYNPINDQAVQVENFSPTSERILWDAHDWGVFVAADKKTFVTFVYSPNSRWGASCNAIATMKDGALVPYHTDRPFGFTPVLLNGGQVVCQMQNGSLVSITLQTHQYVSQGQRLTAEQQVQAFQNHLALHRLDDAWKVALQLNLADFWAQLAEKALQTLDIEMAMRVHRHLGQPAMVMALERIQHVQEKHLLLGHVCMFFKQFDEAQQHFMRSSHPHMALDMRRDLMHWELALKLAEQLAPQEIPQLSREYAQQLEFKGEFSAALDMYQRAVVDVEAAKGLHVHSPGRGDDEFDFERKKLLVHNKVCNAGITRNTIRMGDIRRGLRLAIDSEDADLCQESAVIFEEMKQWNDAAQLYEAAGQYDRAAQIHIVETKNLQAASRLLPKITSTRIFNLYARAKEKDGSYKEAEEAYEKAGDMDAVIRLNVDHLDNLAKAHVIVRKTKSVEGAALVAKRCKKQGDYKTAIEFLLLAKNASEAFELAQQHAEMQTYAEALGPSGTSEDYLAIANYYESKGDYANAGDYFFKCEHYAKALKRYIQCGESQLTKAIEVVGRAKNETLTHLLMDFLMGEPDGQPKDPNYIFKLYMALGNYEKAGKTAVIIAKQEQEIGNYRVAHRILYDTYRELDTQKIRISSDLKRNLMLLHSYIIVKSLVKSLNDNSTAARMLLRVAKNITKFPKHTVPILTSTVIECLKVGFNASALEYAFVLVQPEHRESINEKYKKKIETLVRKRGKEEMVDPEETSSPCPFCSAPCPETALDCTACKNTLPYCVASGKHMVLSDWSYCPNCKFPALYSAMTVLVQEEKTCPMCEQEVNFMAIKKVDNPDPRAFIVQEDEDEHPAT
eukprot:TRINITY_DN4306_c0_g1_i1.p1 TRINITY_DN4306_c0_g1~~TRINITY_DN4306_c0_g1_i1.p1  ORF type:complete len:1383 (+),score=422.30 TRINITY_DN4306_c0_g1_i1:301-4449(+)